MEPFTIISDGPVEELYTILHWLRGHRGHPWQIETMEFVPLVLAFSPLTLGIVKQIEVLIEQDSLPIPILRALFTEDVPQRDERAKVKYSLN
jgi:hypothetical protein